MPDRVTVSGDLAEVERALADVADLGTVVLAARPPLGIVEMDLYSDLHLRGLRLVGDPGVDEDEEEDDEEEEEEEEEEEDESR